MGLWNRNHGTLETKPTSHAKQKIERKSGKMSSRISAKNRFSNVFPSYSYLLQLVASSLVEITASSCSIFPSRKFFKIKSRPNGFDRETTSHLNCQYPERRGRKKAHVLARNRAIFCRKRDTSVAWGLGPRRFQLPLRQEHLFSSETPKTVLQPVVWHTHTFLEEIGKVNPIFIIHLKIVMIRSVKRVSRANVITAEWGSEWRRVPKLMSAAPTWARPFGVSPS